MINSVFISVCFFLLTSVRFIVFGLGNGFDDTMFNFVMFMVINLHLNMIEGRIINILSDFSMWMFFGLSPHPHNDYTYGFIEDLFDINDETGNNTHDTRRLTEDDDPYDIEYLSDWVDNNKFTLTMMTLVTILTVTGLIYFFTSMFWKNKDSCRSCQGMHRWILDGFTSDDTASSRVDVDDGSQYDVSNNIYKYKGKSYINFLVKVGLITYCNVSTITVAQLVNSSSSRPALDFMAVCTALVVLMVPLMITNMLINYIDQLYERDFMRKYGAVYLKFTPNTRWFTVVILIKQIIYSILINVSDKLTVTQNTLMTIINASFLLMVVKLKPYNDPLVQLQSTMVSFSTLLITLINYMFIADFEGSSLFYITVFYGIVHGLTLLIYFGLKGYNYIQNKNPPRVRKDSFSGEQVLAAQSANNSVENIADMAYRLSSRRRFSDELKENDSHLV